MTPLSFVSLQVSISPWLVCRVRANNGSTGGQSCTVDELIIGRGDYAPESSNTEQSNPVNIHGSAHSTPGNYMMVTVCVEGRQPGGGRTTGWARVSTNS